MPKLNTEVVTRRAAQRGTGRDYLVALAQEAGFPYGTLRNAVAGRQPLSLPRVMALAEILGLSVDEMVDKGDGVPDRPPVQPKNEPTHPTPPARPTKSPKKRVAA